TADLWRSQVTTDATVEIAGDLETAPETMIVTTPEESGLSTLAMTWSNPAWFYQALALAFAGLLVALVGLGLVLKRAAGPQERGVPDAPDSQPRSAHDPRATPTEEVAR